MMQSSFEENEFFMNSNSSLSSSSPSPCSKRWKRTLLLSVALFGCVCFLDIMFLQSSPTKLAIPWNGSSNNDNNSKNASSSLLRSSNVDRPTTTATFGGVAMTPSTPDATTTTTTLSAKSNKPKLILHVGPPKTGTTTLQTELTAWSDYLALDNYVYKGREYHPTPGGRNGDTIKMNPMIPDLVKNLWQTCSPEYYNSTYFTTTHEEDSNEQESSSTSNTTTTTTMDLSTLFDQIKQELEPYRLQKTNVIVSDEVLSKKLAHADCYKNLKLYLGGNNNDNDSNDDDDDGWEIIIVANYRRIFEWVPSSKFQQERAKMDWPGSPGGGWSIGPLFPDVLTGDHYYRGYYFTDFVVEKVNGTMPVIVLSMYDGDLLSNFLCGEALQGTAPHSCEASLSTEIREAAADENRNMRAPDEGNILYYDALGLAALERGWINRSAWHRWQVKDMVQDYTVQTLNQTALDFPQICPSQKELQEFLEGSLDVERKVYPVTVAKAMEQEHRQKFWFLAEKTTTYCWIDIEATLKDPVWTQFFTQFH